ncbi:MAG TPA: NADPH-dependent FMN reductase [Trueperaceae bacterium]|nr:NADPH-dependent FMN reductase [Trueperaceae bacterium]
MAVKVAVFVGSLRDRSYNHRLALALQKLGPDDWQYENVPIDEVPYYDQDSEAEAPESVARLKRAVEEADALMFVTPEYNRSIPGVLKNAIDWASRPKGQNSFAGKPALIAGTSTGKIGTAVAQAHLRSVLAYLDVPVMAQPEVYVYFDPDDLIDMEGEVGVAATREFLAEVMRAFEEWIVTVKAGQASVEKGETAETV